MLRPVHTTTIARAAPIAPVRRRRAAASAEAGSDHDAPSEGGLSPFEAASGGLSTLRAAGARTTPAFRAALLKLTPRGE